MKKVIVTIASVLIVTLVVCMPHASLANNAESQAGKKITPTPTIAKRPTLTPTKTPQKSVQGTTSSQTQTASVAATRILSPAKGATPSNRPTIKPTLKPTGKPITLGKPSSTPTVTLVRIAGQLAAYEVSSKSGDTLTVKKKNQSVRVKVLASTQFKQHFWGSTSFANTSIGDKVNVTGVFIDQKKTIMEAQLIRNLSIMKRRGVTFGAITAISSTTISIQAKDIPIQKVSLGLGTILLGNDEKVLLRKDLKVGDRVRIKGLSDRATNTITEVSELKDFTSSSSANKK